MSIFRTRNTAWPRLIALVTLLSAICAGAEAQSASEMLERNGYPTEAYECLFSWQEIGARHAGEAVTGCRIAPRDGDPPFDMYFEGDRVLTPEAVTTLGIAEKDWTRRAISVAAEPWIGAPSPPLPPVPESILRKRGFAASIELPPPDLELVKREDAESLRSGAKGVRRIGVLRDVPGPIEIDGTNAAPGEWEALEDGSLLWSVVVRSPGAVGLRIQIRDLTLPDGTTFFVYNAVKPDEIFGPFQPAAELWTPTCFADAAVIECHVLSADTLPGVSFTIEQVAHMYVDFASLPWSKAAAGSCNLDVTCYPAWANTALGVGGLGSVSTAGALWCTGSLIVDLDPCTQIPFLLTANHCILTDQGADTLEVYWLYQTPTCNGMPPSASVVPRTTGGSDRIAFMQGSGGSGGGNDFCLLRLRNLPPSGLSTMGWATAAPPPATGVTCIHHPRGDYKRITFGSLTNTANPYAQWFHEVTWNAGTTERGSSGSPLMIGATHQIIGQLWGGGASCYEPLLPDYYGRFDVTYPIIEAYLQPPATVGFLETEKTIDEDAHTISIGILLSASAGPSVSILCETVDGSAVAGQDYTALSETVEFESGQSSAIISVEVLDGLRPEDEEYFTLTLRDAQCAALDGDAATMIVRIIDNDPDTDGDGLSDEEEITGAFGYITSPNAVDTDGDGISDFVEVFGTNGYRTNPLARDTDGDGINDLSEVVLGLNPLDPQDAARLASIVVPWFKP